MTVTHFVRRLRQIRDWILLDWNRYSLTAGLLLVGFCCFAWLEASGILIPRRDSVPLLYLFSALATGNITLVTIVISINQLVLSRELRSPRELRTELEAAAEYRETVEAETALSTVPEEPQEFLRVLTQNTQQQVKQLDITATGTGSERIRTELTDLQDNLTADLSETLTRLEETERGVFPALSTILDADFASHLNHSRWIRHTYADDVGEGMTDILDGVEQRLEQLDIARQYFKTMYIQQELADLSKLILYVGFVAELVALIFLLLAGYLGTAPPLTGQRFLIPLAITINLAPLALLFAHVLRIATVARRTAAITPFLTPQ